MELTYPVRRLLLKKYVERVEKEICAIREKIHFILITIVCSEI